MADPFSKAPLYPYVNSEGPKAQHFRGLTLGRLNQFEGGPFPNITDVLFEGRIDGDENVKMEVWSCPGREKVLFKEAVRKHYKPAKKGDMFGPSWTNHWFRLTLTLPQTPPFQDAERVQLEFDPGCEAMIFDLEGCPLQGITGGYGVDRRVEFILPREKRGSTYKYYIEVSCNAMFGNGLGDTNNPPNNDRYFRLASADIVVPRMEAWRLLWDFRVIKDLARELGERSVLGNTCMEMGNEIMNIFRPSDLSTLSTCRKLASTIFGGPEWEKLGHKVYGKDPSEEGVKAWGVPNCHIDTAWLWPFSVTRQKAARSWSTQLDLMDRYPEHRFVCSQAQQMKWVEEDYPLLFQKIKQKAEEGKFIPIGGMWVESDQLLPTGESLVRQLLYGQRYFKSRFGKISRTFWLPDSFGYNAAIPQLARLAGMDFFFTQKTSWNQYNEFPLTSFRWQGQDKSQILVHLCPYNTYTAQASVSDVLNTTKNHKSLQSGAATGLLTFGNGDGGGGPLAPMLENLRRCRAVSENLQVGGAELPKVQMGNSVDDFYEDVLKKTEGGKRLPTWTSELYLEFHQGTATSHGSIKRHNRKTEVLLHDIEFAATLASVLDGGKGGGKGKKNATGLSGYRFPKDEVDALWEDALLCQFHDVLPGSAIGMVYEDAERIYASISEKGSTLLEDALSALIPNSVSLSATSTQTASGELVAIDTLGLASRRELVKVPLAVARGLSDAALQKAGGDAAWVLFETGGDEMVHRPVSVAGVDGLLGKDGGARGRLLHLDLIPGLRGLSKSKSLAYGFCLAALAAKSTGSTFTLCNFFLAVTVDKKGRLTSILDKEQGRELLLDGKTAGFVIFEDTPLSFDAWNVDAFHLETREEVDADHVEVKEDGPLKSSLTAVYQFGKSKIKATISLDAVSPSSRGDALSLLHFDVQVDWHERHRFLKWELPLNLTPQGDVCTYENQFGYIQRSTQRNTTWQRAQYEVCGHRYADVSEFGYGVALINDCKYGHACEGSTLRLSLLRAATVPDAEQDQGKHQFSFAVLPHRSSFLESDVPSIARAYNYPIHLRRITSSSATHTQIKELPFTLQGDRNIVLDTIKRGEDDHFGKDKNGEGEGQESIVLRLYEAYGGSGKVKIKVGLGGGKKMVKAVMTDLLEREQQTLDISAQAASSGNSATTVVDVPRFRAFQVVTVKLILG
ncbi:hypothetical protein JCM11641_001325 [Rhodosporidiobolus odoratus]